ncbi:hypothetical protein PHLGIDRAFT_114722 [Phlebiopsis gigantea 11061_1 CR5-6]|uniref:Uncharacterized protein n=1 Tax=Phlebiopsis gigantea (strain 11061_1 CR5-6) TaxID=745531 RepID=A0A0C3S5M1_PHLG1|nr:hypothetical protein PHLGIDRAFT_114722 [Phlebiopsis gigantea 11061_1 CR5-6]
MTQQLGWLCKATELIGVPMWLAPANLEEPKYVASKDLTSICHHLMDPETGFATDEWTSRPQYEEMNYTVFHADMRLLSERTFETVLAFLKMIVDHGSGLSPSDGWAPMQTFLSPQAFQLFSRQYWWQKAGNQERHD